MIYDVSSKGDKGSRIRVHVFKERFIYYYIYTNKRNEPYTLQLWRRSKAFKVDDDNGGRADKITEAQRI